MTWRFVSLDRCATDATCVSVEGAPDEVASPDISSLRRRALPAREARFYDGRTTTTRVVET
jgi:hypothetical protein